MAEYFQDILPPEGEERRPAAAPQPMPPDTSVEKSIRNININRRTPERRDYPMPPRPRTGGILSGKLIWITAIIAIIVVSGVSLFMFRRTIVTVVPRTHTLVFDNTAPFTAYPAATAASGTLSYSVQTFSFDESDILPAQGVQHVDTKASGQITIINDYSAAPVKLVSTTRFETPSGLIFRVPNDVVVPGKKGATPGSVQVTVIADAPGADYNVGPIAKFTLPGLKGGPLFSGVYARSDTAFTGGFSGDQLQTAPGALQAAQAQMRDRLNQKLKDALASIATGTTALLDLARVTYTDMPNTPEGNNNVRIGEHLVAEVPVFATDQLAATMAQSISSDTQLLKVTFVPDTNFSARYADVATTSLGTDPISFTLTGKAQIVWIVDKTAIKNALAGRDQGAFQTIISGFPFIQEAKARIEPFWSSTFPKDPNGIDVIVEPAPKS